MNPVAAVLLVTGSLLSVAAGIGLLRLRTPFARLHAAGKASPVAFVITATGAAIELGPSAAARLAVVAGALILTSPIGTHLLFRAVHRKDPSSRPVHDELTPPPIDLRPGPVPDDDTPVQ